MRCSWLVALGVMPDVFRGEAQRGWQPQSVHGAAFAPIEVIVRLGTLT